MRGGPRRDEARYGLVCPVCAGRELRVVYTRGAWGNVVNRCRECQACRSRVTTKEVAAFWQYGHVRRGRDQSDIKEGQQIAERK